MLSKKDFGGFDRIRGGGLGFFFYIADDGGVANHDGLKCEDEDEMSAWNTLGGEG